MVGYIVYYVALVNLEACGEAFGAVKALLAVVEVGLQSVGPVTLPPGHVVVGEEATGMLDGPH